MNKTISIIITLVVTLTGCASKPVESYFSSIDRKKTIQFPSDKSWQDTATFKIKVNYDEEHDSKDQRKMALQTGVSRGLQLITSFVSFYIIPKPKGEIAPFDGGSFQNVCHRQSMNVIEEKWEAKDLFRLKKICNLSLLLLNNIPEFAITDSLLSDPRFSLILSKESSLIRKTDDSYYKTFNDKLVTTNVSNIENLEFTVESDHALAKLLDPDFNPKRGSNLKSRGIGNSLSLSFHRTNQEYVLRDLWAYGQNNRVTSSIYQTISAMHINNDDWGVIIPNLALVDFLKKNIPNISAEQYRELAKSVTEKLDEFELGDAVHKCDGNAASDICINKYPEYWESTINSEKRVTAWVQEYFSLVKTFGDDAGYSKQNSLAAFAKIKTNIEEIEPLLAETWGFILLNNTTIKTKREKNSVTIEFKVDFKKAFDQFKLDQI